MGGPTPDSGDLRTPDLVWWRRLDLSPDARRSMMNHGLTLATEFLVLGASFLVLKLAAAKWGASGFGEFVLGRRTIGLLQLPTLCGMALGLTRSVAMIRETGRPEREWVFLDAALLVTTLTSLLMSALLVLGAPQLASLVLGDEQRVTLARALGPCVVGLVFHGVAYGLLRGRLSMVQANLFQIVNLGVIPLLVFALRGMSVAGLLLTLGSAQTVIALAMIGYLRLKGPRPRPLSEIWTGAGKELLRYGGPRVPGEFILGALGALPVTAAAHYGGAVAAGQVGLGLSLLTLLGSVFSPLGLVLLPSVSGRLAAGRIRGLAREIYLLTAACAGLTLIGVLGVELLAPWLLTTVFGPEFLPAVTPVRIIILAAVPYVAYVVNRNVLDALHAAPLNAGNLLVALLTFGVVLSGGRSLASVPPAVAAAMTVLGGLTLWRTHVALAALRVEQPA